MRGRVVSLLVILAVSVGERVADADPTARAKEHQTRGARLYATQDYEGAITEWRAAFVLVPDPDTLFAIGQAQRLKGDCAAALVTYRNVLREKVTKKQRSEVEKVITVCEDVVNKPAPSPVVVEPTRPEVVVAEPSPAPTVVVVQDEPVRSSHTPWYRDKLGMVLLATGVVGLGVGGSFLVLSSGSSSDADGAASYEEFDRHASRAEREQRIGLVGIGAGGALALGAILRFATRDTGVDVRTSVGTRPGDVTGIAIGGAW